MVSKKETQGGTMNLDLDSSDLAYLIDMVDMGISREKVETYKTNQESLRLKLYMAFNLLEPEDSDLRQYVECR